MDSVISYRGYVIQHGFVGLYFILKEGTEVGRCPGLVEAKKYIDKLVDG